MINSALTGGNDGVCDLKTCLRQRIPRDVSPRNRCNISDELSAAEAPENHFPPSVLDVERADSPRIHRLIRFV